MLLQYPKMEYFIYNFKKLLVALCITISLLSHNGIITTNAAKKFSSLLIFGDSLVDTGNNNYIMTFTRANQPPYGKSMPNQQPTGRFSDGRLMGDLLAGALGIKDLVPPFLQPNLNPEELKTGVCFASAGSGYDELTTQTTRAIPVTTQLSYFQQYVQKLKAAAGGQAQEILANTLVFAVAGSNDYMLNYYMMPQRKALGSAGFADLLQQKIMIMVKTLYNAGIRNFLIAGIPPFPDATLYNQRLKQQVLPGLQQSLPGSKVVYADIATPMADLTVSGPRYGITNTMMPCCQGMPCMGGFGCPNPKQYLKFDSVHYTEASYTVMAKYLLATAIPQFG